jgi:hypothetical protein
MAQIFYALGYYTFLYWETGTDRNGILKNIEVFVFLFEVTTAAAALLLLLLGMHIGYWWESQKEGDHWEDQDVDGWKILKWILER